MTHFELRMYDGVTGRWTGVDPYGQFYSSYLGMGNNPTRNTDPDGGFTCDTCPKDSYYDRYRNSNIDYAYSSLVGGDGVYRMLEQIVIRSNPIADVVSGQMPKGFYFRIEDMIGAVGDFYHEYDVMTTRQFKYSDKYFHSKANFKATLRGPGGEWVAEKISNLREITDQRFKGDSKQDALEDQAANIYGRERAKHYRIHHLDKKGINYKEAIPKFRPTYEGFPDDL